MEHTASSGFESITQLLQEQQKLMERLEAENGELRRQLADLRRGVGVEIMIAGKRLTLATETETPITQSSQTPLPSSQHRPGGVLTDAQNHYLQRQTDQHRAAAMNLTNSWDQERRSPIADSFVL